MFELFEKFKIPFAVAIPLSFISDFVDKYIFNDWQFVISLVIVLAIDTVLGVLISIRNRTFSSQGFGKFFEKVLIYMSVLILTHVLGHYRIDGIENHVFNWFDHFTYSAIMIREAISILENVSKLKPDLVPGWVLKKLKSFQDKEPSLK